jgi:hypothetical protein
MKKEEILEYTILFWFIVAIISLFLVVLCVVKDSFFSIYILKYG